MLSSAEQPVIDCSAFCLSRAAAGWWAAVFHEAEEIPFTAQAGLCAMYEFPKHLRIIVPAEDTSHILAATFIIDDEWIDLMAQTFLQHDHSAQAAVVVLKGANPLEVYVEVQNTIKGYQALLVLSNQCRHSRSDPFAGIPTSILETRYSPGRIFSFRSA